MSSAELHVLERQIGLLAAQLESVKAERDRLRAVVDAARHVSHLYRIAESIDFDDITPVTVAMERLDVTLRALDVDGDTGDIA